MTATIEAGICQCGCGAATNIIRRSHAARGLVRGEYRKYVAGHGPHLTEAERFWPKVVKTDGCWFWVGPTDKGYGSFKLAPHSSQRYVKAHRWAYEALVGPIPDGLVIDHLCRVRNCVNPEHLEPVTEYENRCRGIASPIKPECINGHEFTPENTYLRNGRRHCRTCRRKWARDHRQRTQARIFGGDAPRPIPTEDVA